MKQTDELLARRFYRCITYSRLSITVRQHVFHAALRLGLNTVQYKQKRTACSRRELQLLLLWHLLVDIACRRRRAIVTTNTIHAIESLRQRCSLIVVVLYRVQQKTIVDEGMAIILVFSPNLRDKSPTVSPPPRGAKYMGRKSCVFDKM